MTTQRDDLVREVGLIHEETLRLLEGMDYSLDWKAGDEEWSAREVVYHLVDTPEGGPQAALQAALNGTSAEVSISSGLTNLDDRRRQKDLGQVREDIDEVFVAVERLLGEATDAQLVESTVPLRSISRGTTEERRALDLVQGLFMRHWREHMGQFADLRDSLGLD